MPFQQLKKNYLSIPMFQTKIKVIKIRCFIIWIRGMSHKKVLAESSDIPIQIIACNF